jgi:hypothetical protein
MSSLPTVGNQKYEAAFEVPTAVTVRSTFWEKNATSIFMVEQRVKQVSNKNYAVNLFGSFFGPEYGGNFFLRIVGELLPDYMASYLRRQHSSKCTSLGGSIARWCKLAQLFQKLEWTLTHRQHADLISVLCLRQQIRPKVHSEIECTSFRGQVPFLLL